MNSIPSPKRGSNCHASSVKPRQERIGRQQFERLVARSRRFSEAWDDFAREVDLQDLGIDPDQVFAGTRDSAPGRDSNL
jgi:hypothetical protein